MSWLFALILACLSAVLVYTLIRSWMTFAPWFPTRVRDYQRIVSLSGFKPGQIFFDLGCGFGGVARFMARQGAKATGVEYVLPIALTAKIWSLLVGSSAEIKWGDLFKTDLSKADVVFLFGLPETLTKERYDHFSKACRRGATLICYVFPFEGVKPDLVDKPDEQTLSMYVYKMN